MIPSKALAFFALEAFYFIFCHPNVETHPRESPITVLFKCLPIAYLIWLCTSTRPHDGEHRRYRDEVTIALIFSILGDVCLVWRHTLFIPGALLFAAAHLFYIRAFRMKPLGLQTGGVLFLVSGVVFMFFYPSLKLTADFVIVPFYIILIFGMWWRAIVRWQRLTNLASLLANIGAFVFVASDFCISVDKWVADLPHAAIIIMALYYLAQFFLTMSVVIYRPLVSQEYDDDQREKKRG